jgi:hypothetical protein
MRTATLALLGLLMSGGMAMAATGTSSAAGATGSGTRMTGPAGAATGTTRFASEAEAAKACGASNVVWANTSTKVYHLAGDKYFGHTKHGAWMCMGTAKAEGFHQSGVKSAQANTKG